MLINGIFTEERDAQNNKKELERFLGRNYARQNIKLDYLYNATHLAGFGDLVSAAVQKIYDNSAVIDYDLREMLNDASAKVGTQKLLVVGYSQGNFYANSFYDKVAGVAGGVPKESIGVFSVATPSGRVAGGGQYVTSDTDSVIAGMVGKVPVGQIMPPNTHIDMSNDPGANGHSLVNIYLKYRAKEVVGGIQNSLSRLETNNIQNPGEPCIDPPELTVAHKIVGVVYEVADPVAKYGLKGVNNTSVTIAETPGNIARLASATGNLIYENTMANPQNNANMAMTSASIQATNDFLNGRTTFAIITPPASPAITPIAKATPQPAPVTPPVLVVRVDNSALIASLMSQISILQSQLAQMQKKDAPQPPPPPLKPVAMVAEVLAIPPLYQIVSPGFGGGGPGPQPPAPPAPPAPEPTITTPSAPTGLQFEPGDASFDLAWTAPADSGGSDIFDYEIHFSTTTDFSSDDNIFIHPESIEPAIYVDDSILENDTAYYARVRAKNEIGYGEYSLIAGPITPVAVSGEI